MSRWRSNEIIQTVDMIQAKVMPLAQLLHPGGPIFAADKLNKSFASGHWFRWESVYDFQRIVSGQQLKSLSREQYYNYTKGIFIKPRSCRLDPSRWM